jgi:pilus assembly protein CpaE
MARATPVIIIGAHDPEETLIRSQLEGVAEVVASESDAGRALPVIRENGHSIAVLYLDRDREGMLSLARELSRSNGCAPIMVSRDRDSDTILTAMRSGVRDFAYLEESEADVRRAVLNLSKATPSGDDGAKGTVIAVFSAKGGSGATTIATNLGGAILTENPEARAVIVDLNLQMGDVLVFLDLASRYGFADLLKNLHRLDDELVHKSLTAHSCGLRVLAQSDQVDEADDVDANGVAQALEFLRRQYDYVIIDGLRDFRESALVALDSADYIALTMTPDIPALKNANRCLALFNQLGYGAEKVKLLLNRFHRKGKLDLDATADALGRRIDHTIANDFPTAIAAINQGELLSKTAPRERVTRDIHEALPVLGVSVGASEPRRRKGLFGRLAR